MNLNEELPQKVAEPVDGAVPQKVGEPVDYVPQKVAEDKSAGEAMERRLQRRDELPPEPTGAVTVVEFVPHNKAGMAGLRYMVGDTVIAGASFAFLRQLLDVDPQRLDPALASMEAVLRRRLNAGDEHMRRKTFWRRDGED